LAPRANASAIAKRLSESAARGPALLAAAARVRLDHPPVNRVQRFGPNAAERPIDLFNARRDVADVIDVEALHARVALRHVAAGEKRFDRLHVIAEHPEMTMTRP